MFVFTIVAGGLLLSLGAILTIMNIVPTSLDASWNEVKEAFRIMFDRPQFRIGVVCVVIGFLMVFVPMVTAFRW